MKRLYENIENINIKGDVSNLSNHVTTTDREFQNIAIATDNLCRELMKYSSSNKGKQYEKVVSTSIDLRNKLFQVSEELNDMQNQLVRYINKVIVYEDMNGSAQRTNPYLVTKKSNISVDTKDVKFEKIEMMHILNVLKQYSSSIRIVINRIFHEKNEIGSIWIDRQYQDYSMFIDDVVKNVDNALKVFDEYVVYLEEKIKELS